MKIRQLVSHLVRSGASCALVVSLMAHSPARAAIVSIGFTGLNLVYDGFSIYDAGSSAGGFGDPADADPLQSVDFAIDNVPVGSLSSDISVDVFIPDVSGISAGANVVDVQTTLGNPGFFDLLIGSSAPAAQFLLVDLDEVTITYIDVQNLVRFTFGASVSDVFAQNLPFVVGDPVSISFSAQVVAGTLTDNGSEITGFNAVGTGEFQAPLIPEPSTCLLAMLGLVSLARRNR